LYSEREYTLLHSAVQLLYYHYPHPPKEKNEIAPKIKEKLRGHVKKTLRGLKKNHDVGGHHQQNSFLIRNHFKDR